MELDYVYVLLIRDLYDRDFHIEGVYKTREAAEASAEIYGEERELMIQSELLLD